MKPDVETVKLSVIRGRIGDMSTHITDKAVEAAARVMAPTAWGPSVWTFTAHGEHPTDARNRVQKQALQDARAALEAAAPFMEAS